MSEERAEAGADRDLGELEARLGHRFRDRTLLAAALQHASWANETPGASSNERLEFLGDAVIGLVVAHLLFDARPLAREGDLSTSRDALVDERALARVARELGLGGFLRLGRTERQSGGQEKGSILGDAMEAIFGALYLDAGLAPVTDLARRVFAESLRADAPPVERDFKTRLNERAVAESGEFPSYELVSESGIEGDDLRFRVRVRVAGVERGEGVGRTKRAAEQAAAADAFRRTQAQRPSGAG